MIVANELRIGNYIQLFRKAEDKEMTWSKIKSIYFDDEEQKYFAELEDGFRVNIDTGIEPIILTEDILIMYGFKEETLFEDTDPSFTLEDFVIQCGSWEKKDFFFDIDVEIKNLHHLQNIYFDIKQKELTYSNLKKDIWFIDASNIQKEMLQRFIEKYGWEQFEYGCYLEHDSVTLILQTFGKPDELEVQLRQTKTFTIGDRIAAKCQISLFKTNTHDFERNLIVAYTMLQKELYKFSDDNKDVMEQLQHFFSYLHKNLGMMIAMGAERNIER